jgi:hypothetical protein
VVVASGEPKSGKDSSLLVSDLVSHTLSLPTLTLLARSPPRQVIALYFLTSRVAFSTSTLFNRQSNHSASRRPDDTSTVPRKSAVPWLHAISPSLPDDSVLLFLTLIRRCFDLPGLA